jgi:SAM-dependent methyltransferase
VQSQANSKHKLPGLTVKEGFTPHPFDAENGVRTSGLVSGRHLRSGHAHDRHSTAYYGVAPSVFCKLMQRWRRTRPAAEISQTTFIDIGAGMGRALLLAAQTPFRQVIGVELNPALVRVARRNVAAWRKAGREKAPLRVVEVDAAEFVFPTGPAVVFMFNPFGAVVMRRLLKNLARVFAERPGALDLLYVNDEQAWVLEQQKGFARLFSGKVPRSHADNAADKRILDNQPDGEYASAPYEDCSIWRWIGVE